MRPEDVIFVFSVGGGNLEKNVSPNLVRALQFAKEVGSSVIGVVGRDGGYTGKVGDAVCIIPTVNPASRCIISPALTPSLDVSAVADRTLHPA